MRCSFFFVISLLWFPDPFTLQSILSSFCIIFEGFVFRHSTLPWTRRVVYRQHLTARTFFSSAYANACMWLKFRSRWDLCISLCSQSKVIFTRGCHHTLPPATSLTTSTPLTGIRPFTLPLRSVESLAEWLTGPQTQVMSPTSASASAQTSHRSSIRWTTFKRKRLWHSQNSSHLASHKAAAANQ